MHREVTVIRSLRDAAVALGAATTLALTACAWSPGLAGASPAAAPAADPAGPIHTAADRLVDADGRVVIPHGVNVVAKHAPYTPESMGFDAPDADLLAAEGFDSVRLGVMWKAAEPEPGRYDDAYLASVRDTVRLLHSRGLRVLLDAHQDLYNERFQGEFAPDWAVTVTDWPAEPRLGFPGNMFAQPALLRQYEDFLSDAPGPGGVGIATRFAAMWGHVAGFFAGEPNLLGYDLLNEPWPGANWIGCATEQLCVDHTRRLGELHQRAATAIRAADDHTTVFYEPYAVSNPGAAVNTAAPDVPGRALSFHSYCIPAITAGIGTGCDVLDEHTVGLARERAARDGAPALLTEFGAKKNPETITPVVRATERQSTGWMYWAYCDCGDPTTSGPGEQGLLPDAHVADPASAADGAKLDALAAARPTALAGTPVEFGTDPGTGTFHLTWDPDRAGGDTPFGPGAETTVTVPPRAFPGGYRATVDGGTVVSAPGATRLVVRADRGGRITLTLTRGASA